VAIHEGQIYRLSKQLDEIRAEFFPDRDFSIIAFATCIHYSMVQDAEQVLRDTLQDVCSRFNKFLTRQFVHRRNKGLLIIDDAHQPEYRRLLADFKRIGTDYEGYLSIQVQLESRARETE